MIRAVIFDSDGMLSHGPRFSDTYSKERNIPIEDMVPFFVGPFQGCVVGKLDIKQVLQDGWLKKWGWTGTVDEFMEYWFSVGDSLDEQVYATISEMDRKGIPSVLATNQERYRGAYLTKKFGYDKIFKKVFLSSEVGSKKPEPEFFQVIFDALTKKHSGIAKDEVLFWDDDMENVEGARTFGFEARQYTDFVSYQQQMQILGLL